jgi:hypothetical protein
VPGCLTLDRYRPVDVVVQDAETGQPIPAAAVRISYPLTRSSFAPHESSSVTGLDGVARVDTARNPEACVFLDATAADYLSYPRDLSAELARHSEPASWFGATSSPPLRLAVTLYAAPRFCIEWTVPTGFRGLMKAEVQLDDNLACPVAQRCFRFDVPPSGQIQVTVPGLLRHYPPAYRARYADGTALSADMDALKIGIQWLKRDGAYEYFVVGTQVDYENFRRESPSRSAGPEQSTSDGGKGKGHGGRRNRGNPAASPSP